MSPVLSQEAKLLARLAELDATAPPAPTRGARTFLVDRALEFAAIARATSSPTARRAALRRRGSSRARSKGYVSIMVRLGEAFRDRPDSELARYRSRRITWKLAQRVVRTGRSAAEIREALLIEATLWSPGGSRRPHGRAMATRGATASPRSSSAAESADNEDAGVTRTRSSGAPHIAAPRSLTLGVHTPAWRSDIGWAARDPAAYLQAYERHLRTLHRSVTADFARALEFRVADDAARPAAGPFRLAAQQSLRQLTSSLAQSNQPARAKPSATPEDATIIARLAEIARFLQASAGDFLSDPETDDEQS